MQRDYSMMTKAASSLAMLIALATPAYAQYPGHIENGKKKAPTVRSIAVLEWTGDMGKPSASRIIPISVFDGEQYQPGGLYLAKPEPLALEPGTEYVLQDAGIARGLFDINTAQDVDGYWFGYGAWKPMAAPPKRVRPKQGKNMPQVVTDANDGRPHFKNRNAGGSQDSSSSTDSTSSPSSAASTDSAAPETPIGGADPDRPHIVRGQQNPTDADFQPAQLTGVPSGLEQMIAVSDATDRESHPFVYLRGDPTEATK